MEKVLLRAVSMGALFSRCLQGYAYTKSGEVYVNHNEEYVYCYCLDSGREYPWEADTRVYLQYEGAEEVKFMEIPKVYKALALEDGVLKSIIAGREGFGASLEYQEGEVTYAPEGSMGIFADAVLKEAIRNGQGNYFGQPGILVVHEAVPLGTRMWGEETFMEYPRYPAILLGKEVWRERPKPKFKVGDKVRGVLSYAVGCLFTITRVFWSSDEGYAGEPRYLYTCAGISYSEYMLELAPKEEWVDVTEECTVDFLRACCGCEGGTTISVHHNSGLVARMGFGEPWILSKEVYKIELATKNYLGQCSSFKVFKKVTR